MNFFVEFDLRDPLATLSLSLDHPITPFPSGRIKDDYIVLTIEHILFSIPIFAHLNLLSTIKKPLV